MAFGLKTYEDKVAREDLKDLFKQEYPQASWYTQEYMTAKECDERYGTTFSPNPKMHPLYRMLKARKEGNMTL